MFNQKSESVFGYKFKNQNLLNVALTHSSYANERGITNNERLEFLGDLVLDFIAAEYLFETYPNKNEGILTKMKAQCVSKPALAAAAKEHGLDKRLITSGCMKSDSMLDDVVEAVVAAVYLDGGMDAAKNAVLTFLPSKIHEIMSGSEEVENDCNMSYKQTAEVINYKAILQENVQRITKSAQQNDIEYKTERENGPDHMKLVHVACYVRHQRLGSGDGNKKKDAEQAAAHKTLQKLEISK